MRIIAGKWRRRQITAPAGPNTRPILDRAKTVLFDMLGHRLGEPGRLPPLAVLDLFAGSGALGIEAISRGARFGLFVERHRPTAALIRRNFDVLGIVDEARVMEGDAGTCAFPPPPGEPARYELVFVDPPYRLLAGATPDPAVAMLLNRLAAEPVIADDALVVVRHGVRADGGVELAPLIEVERRDVGKMTLRFLAVRADGVLSVDDEEPG